MALQRNTLIFIVTAALLATVAGIAVAHFLHVRDESHRYETACPACHVVNPRQAAIYALCDTRDTAGIALPSIMRKLLVTARPTAFRPVLIAAYPGGDTAMWCAAKNDTQQQLRDRVSNLLCNGYDPAIEQLTDSSRLLHFATAAGNFFYLLENNATVGCSYNKDLLIGRETDAHLPLASAQGQATSSLTVYDSCYTTYDLIHTSRGLTLRHTLTQLPAYLTGDADTLPPPALPQETIGMLHASCHTAPFLSSHLVRLTIRLTDSTTCHILAAPITDRRTLGAALQPHLTPYGYHMSRNDLAALVPATWLTADSYWLDAGGRELLIATDAQALRLYSRAQRTVTKAAPASQDILLGTIVALPHTGHPAPLPGIALPTCLAGDTLKARIIATQQGNYVVEATIWK